MGTVNSLGQWAKKDSNSTPNPRDFDVFSKPEVKAEAFSGSFRQMLVQIEIVKRNIMAIEANVQNRENLDDAYSGVVKAEMAFAKLISRDANFQ